MDGVSISQRKPKLEPVCAPCHRGVCRELHNRDTAGQDREIHRFRSKLHTVLTTANLTR
jgi:hypothetical protein